MVDLLTTKSNADKILGVGLNTKNLDASIYVPIAHRIGENADKAAVMAFLAEFAANQRIIKAAHNLAFESMFLYKHGIVIQEPVYDTIAAAQMTLRSNTEFRTLADSGLKTLVPDILDIQLPTFSDVTGGRHFDELDPQDVETVRYACADTDYALRLYHIFNEWFDRWLPKHRNIVEKVESPAAVYVGLMKYNGVLADRELMLSKKAEAEEKLANLRSEIHFITGDVNIGANANTAAFKKYLFNDLGLPVVKTTAKSREAADDETLILLRDALASQYEDLTKEKVEADTQARKLREQLLRDEEKSQKESMKSQTEAYKSAVKERAQAVTDFYGEAKLLIEDYRNSVDYSISNELAMWEKLGAQYTGISKEKIEIDRTVNKLRAELYKEETANRTREYEEDTDLLRRALDERLISYQDFMYEYMAVTADYYGVTSVEYERANAELSRLSQEKYDKDKQLLSWAVEDAELTVSRTLRGTEAVIRAVHRLHRGKGK